MNLIKGYNREFTKEMLEESLFVIDNNCLLFPLKDYIISDKILAAFDKIKKQVYIPFITQIEYLENERRIVDTRKKNVSRAEDERKKIKEATVLIDSGVKNIVNNKMFSSVEQTKKADDRKSWYTEISDFKSRFIDEIEAFANEKLENLNSELIDKKNHLYEEFSWTKLSADVENIREGIGAFLDEVELGEHYDSKVLKDYVQKIKERYKKKISPGYKDQDDKSCKTIVLGGEEVDRSFSDAIFWLDALDFIKQNKKKECGEKYKYLVIISNEIKEDWVVDRKSSSLNIDMYSECFIETGLIAKKIDIWNLLEVTITAKYDEIEESKANFKDNSLRTINIFGETIDFAYDYEFLLRVFEESIKKYKIKFSDIKDMEYIAKKGEKTFDTDGFNSQKKLVDIEGYEFIVGTQTEKKTKLKMIKILFDRYNINYSQLSFEEDQLEDQWKEVQNLDDK